MASSEMSLRIERELERMARGEQSQAETLAAIIAIIQRWNQSNNGPG